MRKFPILLILNINCLFSRGNEVCLVEIDNHWYRAVVAEDRSDQNPLMMCIDFGNYHTVNIYKMRQMPDEFKLPCYSVFIEIGGTTSKISHSLIAF